MAPGCLKPNPPIDVLYDEQNLLRHRAAPPPINAAKVKTAYQQQLAPQSRILPRKLKRRWAEALGGDVLLFITLTANALCPVLVLAALLLEAQ